VLYRDVDSLSAREKMLHEEVASGANQSSLSNLMTPEILIEPAPIFLVQFLGWFVEPSSAQEDVIAQ
jgi:hypothetical protein